MVDGERQDDLVEEPQLVCLGLCHGLPLKDAIANVSILRQGNRARFVACLLLQQTMIVSGPTAMPGASKSQRVHARQSTPFFPDW